MYITIEREKGGERERKRENLTNYCEEVTMIEQQKKKNKKYN